MSTAILLEDDPVLCKEIKEFLASKEIECDTVFDGEIFLKWIKQKSYSIYLLDINVPKINGLDVAKAIRESDIQTPILMLTAMGEIENKIEAFKKGADDYLVKPFHLEELYIRIQALLRRRERPQQVQDILQIADLTINRDEQTVSRNGLPISLTPKEFKLLSILATSNGRILSKKQIADQLWDYHIETNQNTIEVYINFLRNKIDKNADVKLIHTKIGFGYYLKAE